MYTKRFENLQQCAALRCITRAERTIVATSASDSLSLQVGLARRWFDVTATDIDVSMSKFVRSEWLPMVSLQAGLGPPLTNRLLVEPLVRFETLVGDTRLGLRWGVEATIAFY